MCLEVMLHESWKLAPSMRAAIRLSLEKVVSRHRVVVFNLFNREYKTALAEF